MFAKAICTLLLVAVASANLDYEDCGSTAVVHAVTITDCVQQPCLIIKGRDYTLRAHGSSTGHANSLPTTIVATVLGVPIRLYEGNACDDLEVGTCPHGPDTGFTYARILNIGSNIPQLNSVATATVKDETGKIVVCAKLRVEIRNA